MKIFNHVETSIFLLDFYDVSTNTHYGYHMRQRGPEIEELIAKGLVIYEEKHVGAWTGMSLTFKGFWYSWQIKRGIIK